MKKNILKKIVFTIFVLTSIVSCGKQSPDKIFSIAVLNTNLLSGFAGSGFERQLESPSAGINENSSEPVPLKRVDEMNTKIKIIEESYEKVESLPVTDDDKQMIESSLAVYRFAIPVLKNEYIKLADLYDSKVSETEIEALKKDIREKYSSEYEKLYERMIVNGKAYASKHNIKVNWN